jgi:hypothetical protein
MSRHRKTFLRRHARVISLSGAFILFTTFLVKEEVRDYQKDLLGDIQTARSTYSASRNTSEVINTELQLEYLRQFPTPQPLPSGSPETNDQARARLASDLNSLASFGASYQDAYQLRLLLRRPSKTVVDAEKEVNRARSAVTAAMRDTGGLNDKTENRPLTSDQRLALGALHTATFNVSQRIPTYVQAVLHEADDEARLRRRYYDLCSELSYVLYPIGWILTFVGGLSQGTKEQVAAL